MEDITASQEELVTLRVSERDLLEKNKRLKDENGYLAGRVRELKEKLHEYREANKRRRMCDEECGEGTSGGGSSRQDSEEGSEDSDEPAESEPRSPSSSGSLRDFIVRESQPRSGEPSHSTSWGTRSSCSDDSSGSSSSPDDSSSAQSEDAHEDND